MKCGVFHHYPVKAMIMDDRGAVLGEFLIGTAQTLAEAVKLAAREGYSVREPGDGGKSRFRCGEIGSPDHFIVTVYPD